MKTLLQAALMVLVLVSSSQAGDKSVKPVNHTLLALIEEQVSDMSREQIAARLLAGRAKLDIESLRKAAIAKLAARKAARQAGR